MTAVRKSVSTGSTWAKVTVLVTAISIAFSIITTLLARDREITEKLTSLTVEVSAMGKQMTLVFNKLDAFERRMDNAHSGKAGY